MKQWNVEICDVTLRDGEQTPGVSFSCEEKIEVAEMLDATGVEVIEAGFPVVSQNEAECIRKIGDLGLDAKICCLSRALKGDVDAAIDAGVDLVSIFIATSDLHIKHKYRRPREEVLDNALEMIEYAVDHGIQVRFAAEDASRTDIAFLNEMYRKGAEYGAAYSSFADTVGCVIPPEMEEITKQILPELKNKFCVHCHDDMGCATANTLTAAACGAFQLHTTINGIGERAGNASLEEVLVALRMKGDIDRYDLTMLPALSKKTEEISGIEVSKTKAIVGRNAFAHESGIHIAAIIKDPETYEYITPEMVGAERKFVLGKHTGKRALKHIAQTLNCQLSPDESDWVLSEVKKQSEGKCRITREILLSIIKQSKEHKNENTF